MAGNLDPKMDLECLTDKMFFEKDYISRSFHRGNLGSVGQRAAKILAVKVGGLKESQPLRPLQLKCISTNKCCLGSISPRFESFSKFDGQKLCSPLTYPLYITSTETFDPLLKYNSRIGG